ncbi:hypothetical protein VIMY103929_21280 [Vibrio mytili]
MKEMRLQGIDNMEHANAWLPYFIADFNRRFAKPAHYPKDMHRKVRETPQELDDIFSWQETGAMNIVSLWRCTGTLTIPRFTPLKKMHCRFVADAE